MKITYDPTCLEYSKTGHPESPSRVKNIYQALEENGYQFMQPEKVTEEDIEKVHTKEHWKSLRDGKYFDCDTPVIGIKYSLVSAGCAIKAAQALGFSISRPPGHHAKKEGVGGFCYLNNLAIAVAKVLPKYKKVAILDIDVHHGDGTQDIFLGKKSVLYCSIHQSPLFPGTGLISAHNCLNFPLPAGTGEDEYLKYLDKCLEEIKKFKPGLLAVSAGFDTYEFDPIGGFKLKKETYEKIGKKIKGAGLPTFFVLEGGYSDDLGELVLNLIKGFEY